ncbi:unnamed protein product [Ilex paraguariensis]|uniref:Uncharacterized protein n=1 Tax=Ilex paraguariensis TaxID=185542 RepID=A0ABC8R932_9AQUA
MFSESCPPLAWDKENAYTREAVELYFEAGSGVCLSRKEILRYFLEATAGSHLENFGDEEKDKADSQTEGSPADGMFLIYPFFIK